LTPHWVSLGAGFDPRRVFCRNLEEITPRAVFCTEIAGSSALNAP
jgi:hypothetical protein